tara:strand:- start:621 stop:902 length:282 start_codon:yes stop_codon:yes gene_type:complete
MIFEEIKEFVVNYINPALSTHNGFLEIDSFDLKTGLLYIELKGSCQGCSASASTLHDQIAVCLIEEFPDIKSIVDVTDHTKGNNPFYKREENE